MEYVYVLVYEKHIVRKKHGNSEDLLMASNVLRVSKDKDKIENYLENYPKVLLDSPFGYRVSPIIETKRNKEWAHDEYHIVERELE